MGGGDVGCAPSRPAADRDRRSQRALARRQGRGRDGRRAAARQVARLRLGGPRGGRPRRAGAARPAAGHRRGRRAQLAWQSSSRTPSRARASRSWRASSAGTSAISPPRTRSARSPRSDGASEERGAQRGLLAPAHGARPVARPARARRHARRPLRRGTPDRRLHGRPQVLQRPLPLPGAAPRAVLPVRHLRAEHGLGGGRDRHDRPAAVRRDVRVVPGAAVLRADPHRRRLPRAAGAPDRPPLRVHARLLRHVAPRDRGHRDHALAGRPRRRRPRGRAVAGRRPARDRRPPGADLLPHRPGPRSGDLPPGHGVPAGQGDRALAGLRPHAAGHGLDGARVAGRGRCAPRARASRSA